MTRQRFFTSLLLGLALAAPAPAATELELTYLANEGFLLRSGDEAVLIDAFVAEPYAGYLSLPPAILKKMLAGSPPFARVTATLASHVHRDHFQPETAARYFHANPSAILASSPDVISRFLEASPELRNRTEAFLPEEGEMMTGTWGGIRVDFLRLSHGSGRFASLQNLGHIIHIGGWKILHIGDAESGVARFGPYELETQGLDVALIPYWYFSSESGRRAVEEHLVAGTRVAVHVPAPDLAEVIEELGRTDPAVVVFAEPGETRTMSGGRDPEGGPVSGPEPEAGKP